MIQTTVIPSEQMIHLQVPEKYVGKKIVVLMFDLAEVDKEPEVAAKLLRPSQLRGFLSKETAAAMQQEIKQSREEWDTL